MTIGGTAPNQQEFQTLFQKLSDLGATVLKTARPEKKEFRFEISLTLEKTDQAADATPETALPEPPAADADAKEAPPESSESKPPEPPPPAGPDQTEPPESPKGGPS